MNQNVFRNYFNEDLEYNPDTVESLIEDLYKIQKKMTTLSENVDFKFLKTQVNQYNQICSNISNIYNNKYKSEIQKIKADFDKHKYVLFEYTDTQDINLKIKKYLKEVYSVFQNNKKVLNKPLLELSWKFIQDNKSCNDIKKFSDNFNVFIKYLT